MKTNYLKLILAVVLGFSILSAPMRTWAQGTGNAVKAEVITPEDAAKKYPPPTPKGYPPGIDADTGAGGFYRSPYNSKVFDCRRKKRGTLILDTYAKKVFVIP